MLSGIPKKGAKNDRCIPIQRCCLFTQAQFFNEHTIAVEVRTLIVFQQASALSYQYQKPRWLLLSFLLILQCSVS